MSFCNACGAKIENESVRFCPNCGAQIDAPVTSSAPVEPVVEYKMGWYKFLIYFSLFFGAFVNLARGFGYLTGSVYFVEANGVSADLVYSFYGGA